MQQEFGHCPEKILSLEGANQALLELVLRPSALSMEMRRAKAEGVRLFIQDLIERVDRIELGVSRLLLQHVENLGTVGTVVGHETMSASETPSNARRLRWPDVELSH